MDGERMTDAERVAEIRALAAMYASPTGVRLAGELFSGADVERLLRELDRAKAEGALAERKRIAALLRERAARLQSPARAGELEMVADELDQEAP